jgi:hypothetical protein
MTLNFKSTYITAVRARYFKSSKKEKSAILDELCSITGYERKWAIRILAKGHKTGKKASGRTKQYSEDSIIRLKKLWHIMRRINSKKMVAAFPTWLNYYQGVGFNPRIKEEILSMSHSTIDRYLEKYRKQFARTKRTGTVRAKNFLHVIPIKDFTQKSQIPGALQADTVAHCGNSLSGQFVWTLTVTDEVTGWTENRALFGKSGHTVTSGFTSIFWDLPYKVHTLNTDNGTEFLNEKLQNYITKEKGLKFTRSRPYKSNDNAHVEQKNFTHVRELFGYERYDKEELVFVMNDIYKNYFNILYNYFIPQHKCIKVERVGAKYKRTFDKPKTPYQRLIDSGTLTIYEKEKLAKTFNSLNPIELRKDLSFQLKRFKRIFEGKSDYRYSFAS